MSGELIESRLAAALRSLKPKTKQPVSATVLNSWITQAERRLGPDARGGRLGWLVASSVAIAAVQRAVDTDGRQLFLLKGGTLLQHRLNATARTTKDVDGIVRGDLDAFFLALEDALAEPWGPLALRRGEVEVVDVPARLINPRRFESPSNSAVSRGDASSSRSQPTRQASETRLSSSSRHDSPASACRTRTHW